MTIVLSVTNPQSIGLIDHKKMNNQRSNQPLLEDRIVFVLASAIKVKRLGNNSLLRVLSLDLIRKLHQDLIGPESYYSFAHAVHIECIKTHKNPNSNKTKHDNPVFRRKLHSHMLKLAQGNEEVACCYIAAFVGSSLEARFRRVTIEQELDMYIEGTERNKPTDNLTGEQKAINGARMLAYLLYYDSQIALGHEESFNHIYSGLMIKRFTLDQIELAMTEHSGMFYLYWLSHFE